jgi:hypothetical protein
MKKLLFLAVVGMAIFSSCSRDQGLQGQDGLPGPKSEVFELKNVNFTLNSTNEFTIFRDLNPMIFASDNILIYRMSGLINPTTPIWQLIPRTLYLPQGELDYDFDFSKQDFTIYADGTYNLTLTPQFLNNQTFRIVIIPGYFSRSTAVVDFNDYNAVIKHFNINDRNVTPLK